LIALILSSGIILFWVYRVATGLEKTGKGMFILPLKATESFSFGMFSLAHIAEFVNQLLLLSPLGISLIVFFLFFRIKLREFEDKLANFLILAVSFALVYLFVFNFTLGSADWDLRSSPAPFFGLLGALLFLRWGEDRSAVLRLRSGQVRRPSTSLRTSPPSADPKSQMPVGKRFKAWGLIFIWFSLFHTVPWVLINAHHSRSVARYVLIQENDPHPVDEANYNLYKIARILGWAGLPEEVKNTYQRAIDKNPYDTLSYYNLAVVYYNQEKSDQAICYLDSVLKIYPFFIRANALISEIYMKREDFSKALVHMERCLPILADSIKFLYDLALVNFRVGKIDQSLTYVRRIISLNPDYGKAYRLSGYIYMIKQDYPKAKEAWEDALLFFPGDSVALHYLEELENVMKKRR
jgi:predicted negative regulator of RcsB-dependent stress response